MRDYDDEYEIMGCGLGSMMEDKKHKKKAMSPSEKKMKIAEHMESFERMANRFSRCKALSAVDKKSLSKDIVSIRTKFAKIYGR